MPAWTALGIVVALVDEPAPAARVLDAFVLEPFVLVPDVMLGDFTTTVDGVATGGSTTVGGSTWVHSSRVLKVFDCTLGLVVPSGNAKPSNGVAVTVTVPPGAKLPPVT